MALSFAFDASKETPQSTAAKRALVAQLMGTIRTPKTIGEGFSAIGDGIVANVEGGRAREAETLGQASANDTFGAITAMLTGKGGQTPPSGYGSSPSIPSSADADSIRAGLIERGLPEHVADGFLMNFQDESGLNPGINEQNPTVPGSRGGYGLYQLTGPRRVAYEQYAQQLGVDPSNVDAQLDFLMSELQGPEAAAAQSIFAAPDAGTAAAAIARDFLRPAQQHLDERVSRYTGGAPPSQESDASAPVQTAEGPSLQMLMEAAANPWLNDSQKAIINTMISEQMQQQDPRYRQQLQMGDLQMQQAQNELRAPLTVNGQLVDRNTFEVLGDFRNPDDINATGNETFFGNPVPYQDAEGNIQFGQIGNKGTFKPIDLGAGGGQFVSPTKTVNTETEQIIMDQFGNVLSRMPIQNQQAAFDTAVGKGMGENQVQNVTGAPQAIANANTLMSQIDGVLNDPALDQAVGLGGILPAIPNTDQAGVVTKVEQLQGQAFLQAFESLKGGGQITEVEGKKATDAIARLNRVQNKEDFIAALKELRDIVASAQARAAEKGGVTLPETPAVPATNQPSPADIDEILKGYGL